MKGISTLYMDYANKNFPFTIPSMNTSLATLPCYTIAPPYNHFWASYSLGLVQFSKEMNQKRQNDYLLATTCAVRVYMKHGLLFDYSVLNQME